MGDCLDSRLPQDCLDGWLPGWLAATGLSGWLGYGIPIMSFMTSFEDFIYYFLRGFKVFLEIVIYNFLRRFIGFLRDFIDACLPGWRAATGQNGLEG